MNLESDDTDRDDDGNKVRSGGSKFKGKVCCQVSFNNYTVNR